MGNLRKLLAWVLVFSMILSAVPMRSVSAEEAGSAVLSALDFGADPTGAADSTVAIQKALAAAKELEEQGKAVTLVFPQGEYHIYKDKAPTVTLTPVPNIGKKLMRKQSPNYKIKLAKILIRIS